MADIIIMSVIVYEKCVRISCEYTLSVIVIMRDIVKWVK